MTKPAIESLADGLRSHQLDVGWAVATVLRSRAFFAAVQSGTRVQSPVEFTVGAVRALEMLDPPPSTLVLADWAARLGQDLFNPAQRGGMAGWTKLAVGPGIDRPGELRGGIGRRTRRRPRSAVRPDRARPPVSAVVRSRHETIPFVRNCCWETRSPDGSSTLSQKQPGTRNPARRRWRSYWPRRRHRSVKDTVRSSHRRSEWRPSERHAT